MEVRRDYVRVQHTSMYFFTVISRPITGSFGCRGYQPKPRLLLSTSAAMNRRRGKRRERLQILAGGGFERGSCGRWFHNRRDGIRHTNAACEPGTADEEPPHSPIIHKGGSGSDDEFAHQGGSEHAGSRWTVLSRQIVQEWSGPLAKRFLSAIRSIYETRCRPYFYSCVCALIHTATSDEVEFSLEVFDDRVQMVLWPCSVVCLCPSRGETRAVYCCPEKC